MEGMKIKPRGLKHSRVYLATHKHKKEPRLININTKPKKIIIFDGKLREITID